MKNNNYWKQRAEIIANRQNKKADNYIVDLERQYKKALASIQKDLEVFYGRYADAEGIDMATARKLLTNAEKEMWEVSLEEYRRMSLDEQFKEQIESMYSKSRVSRLQALQTQIRANIEILHSKVLEDGTDLLKDTFADTYYRTVYEIEKGTGIAANFARFNEEAVLQIISKPWKHGNFSSNWDNCKRNLLDELETTLSQAFIRGDSMDKVIKNFAKRMDVDKRRAARIVLTEHSYIANEASFKSYQETGVERYEYLATLDLQTSQICQDMDGINFKLSEKMVGVNYPPLHPWCRSTTIPYFDDLDTWIDERVSRDPVTGKTKNVFADTKYPQWYEENVIGAQKVKQYEKELDDWIKGKNNVLTNPKSDIIKLQKEIKQQINEGVYPKRLNRGAQEKHIKGAPRYIEGRSYLTLSVEEAQDVVNKYAGTGKIELNRKKEFKKKELIVLDKNIGVNINNQTNEEVPTNRLYIHYGKNGTHIVPTMKGIEKNEKSK